MTPLDAMRSALEAFVQYYETEDISFNQCESLITNLRTAIAELESAEPVFWYRPLDNGCYEGPKHNSQMEKVRKTSGVWFPLFTHPAQSRDSIIEECANVCEGFDGRYRYNYGAAFADAIRGLKGEMK
jgi:hypothetical protein